MNRVSVIGSVISVPNLRRSRYGVERCKFTLAIPRRPAEDGSENGHDYLIVIVFGDRARDCYETLSVNDIIAVWGKINCTEYYSENRTVYVYEIAAEGLDYLETKRFSLFSMPNETEKEKVNSFFDNLEEKGEK